MLQLSRKCAGDCKSVSCRTIDTVPRLSFIHIGMSLATSDVIEAPAGEVVVAGDGGVKRLQR